MIELRHLDVHHFVTEECRHLVNGFTSKCGCICLILFRYLSGVWAITCDINSIVFVSVYACRVCDDLVASSLGIHEPKWTSHVKYPSDVAESYTNSASCDNMFKNIIDGYLARAGYTG